MTTKGWIEELNNRVEICETENDLLKQVKVWAGELEACILDKQSETESENGKQ